jgi:hypothetical protein
MMPTERVIKPISIGRKGWLFADGVAGTHAADTIFSLIERCKHHGIEAYNWLHFGHLGRPRELI